MIRRNQRAILAVIAEIVAMSLAPSHVRAYRRLPAPTAPLRLFRRGRAVTAGTLHRTQRVRTATALFAARVPVATAASTADLRARDDSFAAHCSETGEEGGEERA